MVFQRNLLNNFLKDEAINAVHNHEVFMHHLPDNGSLVLSIINTIALIYVIYKQNTNKAR